MLIRDGISAKDDDLKTLRDQVNGWFGDVSAALVAVPRMIEPLITTGPSFGLGDRILYSKIPVPTFLLMAGYADNGSGADFNAYSGYFVNRLTGVSAVITSNVGAFLKYRILLGYLDDAKIFGSASRSASGGATLPIEI